MPEETIQEGQGEAVETPVDETEGQSQETEAQPSEQVIEVGGRQFKSWEDVGKSYTEAEVRMRHLEDEKLKANEQAKAIQERYGWADNWHEYLNQNPEKRAEIERIISEEGDRPTYRPDPVQQEVLSMKKELESIKMAKSFDALKAKGFYLDSGRERAIREHIFNTGINDVEGAFKTLFFEDELRRVKSETAKNTGDAMAQSQSSYRVPPTGQAATKTKSPKDMTVDEFNAAIEAELSGVDPLA